MKIGILGNLSRVKNKEIIDELHQFLNNNGYDTIHFDAPKDVKNVDVVIVLGVDGALLHTAVPAAQNGVKLIGINYGNLGFLTEYEKTEQAQVKELLTALQENKCRIVKRSLLELQIGNDSYYALNEIAIQRNYRYFEDNATQILKLEMQAEEGTNILSGDGLLICTPTGSTAYSLSAGGAILTPEVPVFMMTPICAFSMRARPIVFSDTDEFTIRVEKGKSIVLADGGVVAALPENATMQIKKAPFTADFPVKENSDFFARVRNKLNG